VSTGSRYGAWHGRQRRIVLLGETSTHPGPFRPAPEGVLLSTGGSFPMSPIAIVVIAFGMSADAFAAALGKGAALDRPPLGEALRCGLIFGVVEAATPVVGWTLGLAAAGAYLAADHWIAFAVLAAIGAKMIHDGWRRSGDAAKPKRHSTRLLVLTAIGTSIDALAIGVSLALLGVGIAATAGAIGLATFAMTTLRILLGRVLGDRYGRIAETVGGAGLILIGVKILAG
jgi:putative Mn2+ efflux pump MntP